MSKRDVLDKLNESVLLAHGSEVSISDKMYACKLDSLGLIFVLKVMDNTYGIGLTSTNISAFRKGTVKALVNKCVQQ